MALFKISKGLKSNLPTNYVEGYCYFTTDDGKFYIDTSNSVSGRICLNANQADKAVALTTSAGSTTQPIYFSNGKPVAITGAIANGTTGNAATASKMGSSSTTWLYFHHNNELNFGGTDTSTTIFLGYRAMDSRPIPTKFIFGGSTGSADLQAKTVYLGSGTSSYISNTQYTGNAASATKLATARTINSVSFDGSKNITFQGSYVSNTNYNTIPVGISYIEMPATATVIGDPTYGTMLSVYMNAARAFQLVVDSDGSLWTRGLHSNNNSDAGTGYGHWRRILHNDNYTSYTVTKTGSGASGTWGIGITGNAATATKATQDSAGQQINTTYIKSLSVSGTTITYTKGNGSTGTITTQDLNARQTLTSSNTNYPLLMAQQANTVTTNNIDNITYRNNSIYANPSTGMIASTSSKIGEHVTLQYDSTNECLNFIFS